MSCNCNQPIQPVQSVQAPHICGMPEPSCRCQMKEGPRKANMKFCDVCDPCSANESNVKLCAYVVPNLEEGRYYRNSFIFSQEDDTAYYISPDRSEIPFGSRPLFLDDADPTTLNKKNTVVYDVKNKKAYVFGPDGSYMTLTGE